MHSEDDPIETASLLLTGENARSLIERRWRIEVVAGPDRGAAVERSSGTIVAGTRPGEDGLCLTDSTVSRRHAELTLMPEGVMVVDLNSRNGTRLGRQPIDRAFVGPGASVWLGHTELRMIAIDAPIEHGSPERFGEFVSASPLVRRMLGQLELAAKSQATILIEGETGTGKELLAEAIHDRSPRAKNPFVVVDCGAIVETLLESQLFGHKKGAFTGATEDQRGAFEAANGGTIFLDELGELPIGLQPKLLRALESRRVKRVGEVQDRDVDVRIIAATHRDLSAMAKEGRFRSDLFYRVAVVRIFVPPLRERPEDVALLARSFVDKLSGGSRTISDAALDALAGHGWPGNVRELRNTVERAIALTEPGRALSPHDFLLEAPRPDATPRTYQERRDAVLLDFERKYVTELLAKHHGNVAAAAREAGLSRNTLYAMMKRCAEPRRKS